jgi:hypothetical protein
MGSYTSIVNQTGIRKEDMTTYLEGSGKNTDLAQAYYTALGREKYCMYRVTCDDITTLL